MVAISLRTGKSSLGKGYKSRRPAGPPTAQPRRWMLTSPRLALIGVQRGRSAGATQGPDESSRERRPAARDGHGAGWRCPAAPGAGSGAQNMARGPGPLGRPRPDSAAMPKRGKRLKFRAHDACSGRGERGAGRWKAGAGGGGGGRGRRGDAEGRRPPPLRVMLVSVTVADYANSDPAVVRSGRVKKAVANAVQQEGRLPTTLRTRAAELGVLILGLHQCFPCSPLGIFRKRVGSPRGCSRDSRAGAGEPGARALSAAEKSCVRLCIANPSVCFSVASTSFFLVSLFPAVYCVLHELCSLLLVEEP